MTGRMGVAALALLAACTAFTASSSAPPLPNSPDDAGVPEAGLGGDDAGVVSEPRGDAAPLCANGNGLNFDHCWDFTEAPVDKDFGNRNVNDGGLIELSTTAYHSPPSSYHSVIRGTSASQELARFVVDLGNVPYIGKFNIRVSVATDKCTGSGRYTPSFLELFCTSPRGNLMQLTIENETTLAVAVRQPGGTTRDTFRFPIVPGEWASFDINFTNNAEVAVLDVSTGDGVNKRSEFLSVTCDDGQLDFLLGAQGDLPEGDTCGFWLDDVAFTTP